MDSAVILAMILGVALLSLPALAGLAFAMVYILLKVRWITRPWPAMIVSTVIMTGLPLGALLRDHIEAQRCFDMHGPEELMCGGELGGTIIFLLQVLLILGGLIIGPIVGRGTARRFLPPADPST